VLVPIPRIESAADGRPALIVLLPNLELARMTGGPNTAINLAARLASRGHDVRFVATHGGVEADERALREHVARLAGPVPAAGISFASVAGGRGPLRVGPRDVLLATWWPTAHIAEAARSATLNQEFVYLIQDFEPGFYAWSTDHALAAQTYDLPIRAIFNESLLRDHFASLGVGRFGAGDLERISTSFEPAVDRALFEPRPRGARRRLVFYARPRNPRNAFELGLRALREAATRGAFGPEWDVVSVGGQVPDLPLDPTRAIRAVPWRSMPDYAELLGGSDLLLSLMLSPHTSYPPLEMAAGGGRVVTNTFGVKTQAALARISPLIGAVRPTVDALADALVEATRADRPAAEPPPLALPADWGEALEPVVSWLDATIEEIRSR
jgi:hypothetical protein